VSLSHETEQKKKRTLSLPLSPSLYIYNSIEHGPTRKVDSQLANQGIPLFFFFETSYWTLS